ncbi:zinc-dependent alcohol dehydrogenase family protein [Arenibacter sp. F20364]|uniref:zinc-dependent alcohol dehydrogenase family protein n=1 Tax=Arenibacter sp. F20364 TaxID=2926415 RepID=UPI001FF62492|nr:zinc-dependent alcohol dehydrogenase family protein [Arenibacter sp. F20364]MCK0189167.1 zinc-dependent alcohol dehydrogenase family protein [Arenibacter sp. F20364]
MKAMLLNSYGENAAFTATQIEKSKVKVNHLLVKIEASSVNTIDMMIKNMGTDLPLSPALPALLGMDFSGTVEAVGDGVEGFKVGDDVYGCAGGLGDLPGTLTEYIVADSKLVAHKPKGLTMRETAALPLVAITAYEGLTRAGVKAGQKVLVHGGSGGVGHLAVQLAKYFGAEVFATGTGNNQKAIVEKFGATFIDFKTEKVADYTAKYTDGGFDVVFDTVGGPNLTNSIEAVALNGHISTTVSLLEIDLTPLHFKGASLHVVFMLIPMLHNFKRDVHGNVLERLAEISNEGHLTPIVDENRFSLEQVGDAYAHLASGTAIGKVVVEN